MEFKPYQSLPKVTKRQLYLFGASVESYMAIPLADVTVWQSALDVNDLRNGVHRSKMNAWIIWRWAEDDIRDLFVRIFPDGLVRDDRFDDTPRAGGKEQ